MLQLLAFIDLTQSVSGMFTMAWIRKELHNKEFIESPDSEEPSLLYYKRPEIFSS